MSLRQGCRDAGLGSSALQFPELNVAMLSFPVPVTRDMLMSQFLISFPVTGLGIFKVSRRSVRNHAVNESSCLASNLLFVSIRLRT